MPEVRISVGGREYTVACQPGEEAFLRSAAQMLDAEAGTVVGEGMRLPETRVLLMAGLMLADRAAASDDRAQALEAQLAEAEAALAEARARHAPVRERVEVPVVPAELISSLRGLADKAEGLANSAEAHAP